MHILYEVKKVLLVLFVISLFVFPKFVLAGSSTNTDATASIAVDMSAASPQYLSGNDLSPLTSVDNSTLTSGLFTGSINTGQANFIFKFTPGYVLPANEEFKSIYLTMVHKMNVGTIGSHYVVVKYFNKAGVRTTCVSQANLTIPSTQGTYASDTINLNNCQNEGKINTIEVYYYAYGSTLPVNTSFDQVVVHIEHGQRSTDPGPSTSTPEKNNFAKSIDVSRNGGVMDREGGTVKILFGYNSLPYEASIETSKVTSGLVSAPSGLVGNMYKLDVFSSFNGYPLVKFNPALIFLTYPYCNGRPVVQFSNNGKTWQSLFTVRAATPANTVAAVITSPGYYAVGCK